MTTEIASPQRPIATFNEGPLHSGLKDWYAQPGDRLEVPIGGRQIDIVRGDLLIEIQTAGFAAMRKKLESLLDAHPVRLVYPVPLEKWIVRVKGKQRRVLGRRKSPKRGRVEDVFEELVSLPKLLSHRGFSLELLLTREEEVRRYQAGRARWRKGWVVLERRLIDVIESRVIREPADLLQFLPPDLPVPFTTADLSEGLDVSRDLAQKLAYCLRQVGTIEMEGKQRNALTYRVASQPPMTS